MADYKRTFEMELSAKGSMTKTLKETQDELNKTQKELKETDKELSDLEKHMDSLDSASSSSSVGLTTFGGALQGLGLLVVIQQIIELTKTMADMAKATIDANDALGDLSDKTGLSVESLSVLVEAVKFGGGSITDLQKGLVALSKSIADAADGNTDAITKFAKLGISIRDSAGKLKSTETIFTELADAVGKVPDAAVLTSTAFEHLGNAGVAMLPMLLKGGEGLKDLKKDMEELKAVTDENTKNIAGDFNDALQTLGISQSGIGNSLANTFLPAITNVLSIIVELRKQAVAFAADNKGLTDEIARLSDSSDDLDALIGVFLVLADVTQTVVAIVEVLYALLAYVGSEAISAFKAIAAPFVTLFILLTEGPAKAKDALVDMFDTINKKSKDSEKLLTARIYKSLAVPAWSDRIQKAVDDVNTKNMQKEFKDAKDKVDKAASSTQSYAKISQVEGEKVVSAVKRQLDAQQKLIDDANAKVKTALDNKKKYAEEFDALAKRLNKSTPGGDLNNRLGNITEKNKAEANRQSKLDALKTDVTGQAEKAKADAKTKALEDVLTASKTAYDAEASWRNKDALDSATAALQKDTAARAALEMSQKVAAINQEAADKEKENQISITEKMQKRMEIERELFALSQEISDNKKTGTSSESQIGRLRDIGKLLEDNKNKDTGLFNSSDNSYIGDQIQDLAKTAGANDVAVATAQAKKAIAGPMEELQKLQDKLKKLEVSVSVESVTKASVAIRTEIQTKLDENPFKVKLIADPDSLGSLTPSMPTVPNTNMSQTTYAGSNMSIDLRTNSGTLGLSSDMTEAEKAQVIMINKLRNKS